MSVLLQREWKMLIALLCGYQFTLPIAMNECSPSPMSLPKHYQPSWWVCGGIAFGFNLYFPDDWGG